MKRYLFISILVLVLCTTFLLVRFGGALLQEGNPIPIFASIAKLELTKRSLVQYDQTDVFSHYIALNTGESTYAKIKDGMYNNDWIFKDQLGSGLVFEKNGQTKIIETRQYSKYYILLHVPLDMDFNGDI